MRWTVARNAARSTNEPSAQTTSRNDVPFARRALATPESVPANTILGSERSKYMW
ncbi:hypothetical protein D3C74_446770 [compost metagenome]